MAASGGAPRTIRLLTVVGLPILLLAAAVSLVMPETISLTLATSAEVLDGSVVCRIVVENVGQAQADAVAVEVELAGETIYAPEPRKINSGGRIEAELRFDSVPANGRHPVVVRVRYTDLAGYPFTAPSYGWLVVGREPRPRLEIELESVEIAEGEAVAAAWLTNTRDAERAVRARLVLPDEIEAPGPDREVVLGPGERRRETFRLHNVSALAGSSYQVIGLLETVGERPHKAVAAVATVAIVSPEQAAGVDDADRATEAASGLSMLVLLGLIVAAGALAMALRRRTTGDA